MFDTLFGAEVSPALKFVIAFVIVLALIGVTAWLVRRFGAERFGGSSARGRQPRLAVVDAAAIDGRRRLVIIRRDNVEHLLMIGGPTDVLVEQNIVRAMAAPRDKAVEPPLGRAQPTSETATRPVSVAEGAVWPLQPQPETNGRTTSRPLPEEPVQRTWPAAESQRPSQRLEPRLDQLDTVTNPADEFSVRPTPQRESHLTRPVTPPPMSRPVSISPVPAVAPAEKVEKVEKITTAVEPNRNPADMVNRLEWSRGLGEDPGIAPEAPEPAKDEQVGAPLEQHRTPPEPQSAGTEAKPIRSKTLYDSLEEEMASLLGRPPGKT